LNPSISEKLKRQVVERANNRCEYCLSSQELVYAVVTFQIDHVIPRSKAGTNELSNLCLSCWRCNNYKRDKIDAIDPVTRRRVRLFHPRRQRWTDNFRWSEDSTRIIGLTPRGRATVEALRFNDERTIETRRLWVRWEVHPPPC